MPLLIVLAVIVIIVIIWAISTSNNFKRAKIKIDEARSGIEVALTKRYDTLTKLLDVTKGYVKHEKEIFSEVIRLRKGMSVQEMNQASEKMDELSKQINFTAEAYPELRSSQAFSNLQKAVVDVEEHLQAARRAYNSNVSRFNTMIVVFPSSLLAGSYSAEEYFRADSEKRSDIKIDL